MLTPEQKDDLMVEWELCPTREKAVIVSEFLTEQGKDVGWEPWLMFLEERFCITSYWEAVGLA